MNLGGNSSGKLSEAQLAARHSLSVALNMPNLTAKTIGTGDSLLRYAVFNLQKSTNNSYVASKGPNKSCDIFRGPSSPTFKLHVSSLI